MESIRTKVELSILLSSLELFKEVETQIESKDEEWAQLSKFSQDMIQGNYKEILQSNRIQSILNRIIGKEANIEEKSDSIFDLIAAICCLNVFIQINWTGPEFNTNEVTGKVRNGLHLL